MARKTKLYKNAIVEKRNVLNEIRKNSMSLQEIRFFTIYLSKINARDVSTRVVTFPLEEFCKIMDLNLNNAGHNIAQFRLTIRRLLQQIVEVPNERGGFSAFQLFKKCTLDKNELGEWCVTIDAHDDALPLMFDFKSRYFTYELWNALRLKSTNQIRMYEILKQYEKLGGRELSIQELKDLLGIMPDEYSGRTGWSDFRKYVLDSCQEALKENTDICYTYEKGKSGVGGKWLTIVFHIFKNKNHVDQLSLEEFIAMKSEPKTLPDMSEAEPDWETIYGSENMAILADACEYEFDKNQMDLIFNILTRIHIPKDTVTDSLTWGRHKYLREMYAKLNITTSEKLANGEKIVSRFKYFVGMLENNTFQPSAYFSKESE